MKVTLVSDSTYVFEHNGVRLLTDPWIGGAIGGGAWVQYPPPVISAQDIGRLDFIFISHVHQDHCDPDTLRHLDRNATVLIMDRQPNFVDTFLKQQGFSFKKVQKIRPFQSVEICPGLAAEVIDADPQHELNHLVDSSLLLHWGKQSLYFANDNPPYTASLAHLKKYRYRLALLPASGGSGYPATYTNLSADEKNQERDRIQKTYLNTFVETIEALRPDFFTPCAGSHIISGQNARLNQWMAFLPSPMVAFRYTRQHLSETARERCLPLLLSCGQSWDEETPVTSSPEKVWDKVLEGEPEWISARNRYISDVAAKLKYDYESHTVPPTVKWEDLFLEAAANLIRTIERTSLEPSGHVYLSLPSGKRGHIAFEAKVAEIVANDKPQEQPHLSIGCDPRLMHQLLTGKFNWNAADGACILEYSRIPNRYDNRVIIALNYLKTASGEV